MERYLTLGGVVLLLFIFGVPAVLVPATMSNVPERARLKVLTLHGTAVQTVTTRFQHHNNPAHAPGRLEPLPADAMGWIKLINPTGRKAPGGGQAILPEADDNTGAIGITGDQYQVTITLPAYAGLSASRTLISPATVAPLP